MKAVIEVKNCEDCPFRKSNRGHGECWEYCNHPENGRPPYEDILWGCQERFRSIPNWCPLLIAKSV